MQGDFNCDVQQTFQKLDRTSPIGWMNDIARLNQLLAWRWHVLLAGALMPESSIMYHASSGALRDIF